MKVPRFITISALAIVFLGVRASALATCNVIPASGRTFPSTLGEVTTPFGLPCPAGHEVDCIEGGLEGQVVTVRREEMVFAAARGGNGISLRFQLAGGTVIEAMSFEPREGSRCLPPPSEDCVGERCRCTLFAFPDTDTLVGSPSDRHTLTGPVSIEVRTGGVLTARIDSLFVPGSPFRDNRFPSFVALPKVNIFDRLRGPEGGELLGAADDEQNLFVPVDFLELVGPALDAPGFPLTHFVEARVPALAALGGARIDSFTPDGQRLPPLIFQNPIEGDYVVGTVDAQVSVLRLEKGARAAPPPEAGMGPIVIPGVRGFADAKKRANPFTLLQSSTFAVYENRESGPGVGESEIADLNRDGDTRDFILYTLDLTRPQADPVTVFAVDVPEAPSKSPLDERVRLPLYAFDASDQLLAFRIPELFLDFNGNGRDGDVLFSGALDLVRGREIPEATGSPRLEIAGGLLAFSIPLGAEGQEPDALTIYDVALDPSADPGHPNPFFFVDAQDHILTVPRGANTGQSVFSRISVDFAADADRVAFLVPVVPNDPLPCMSGCAVWLFERGATQAVNLQQLAFVNILGLSSGWLTFASAPVGPVTAIDLTDSMRRARPICDVAGSIAQPVPFPSNSLVPCATFEQPFPAPFFFRPLLHAFLPRATEGPVEIDLNLALSGTGVFGPRVSGDTLVVAVDEARQGTDLDGDGKVGEDEPSFLGGPFVLHVFNGQTRTVRNLGVRVASTTQVDLDFVDRGLVFISPEGKRTFLRDLDEDGSFATARCAAPRATPSSRARCSAACRVRSTASPASGSPRCRASRAAPIARRPPVPPATSPTSSAPTGPPTDASTRSPWTSAPSCAPSPPAARRCSAGISTGATPAATPPRLHLLPQPPLPPVPGVARRPLGRHPHGAPPAHPVLPRRRHPAKTSVASGDAVARQLERVRGTAVSRSRTTSCSRESRRATTHRRARRGCGWRS